MVKATSDDQPKPVRWIGSSKDGLPEADEELTKAQLASHIRQVIKRQRLTQVTAAALMHIDQPKVSAAPQWPAR
jgi:predicted XRE-type DNA-binding protein